MTYPLLCAVFLAVAAMAGVALRAAAGRSAGDGPPPRAREILPVAAALIVLTAVFDNLMIVAGLFAYTDERTSGLRIGLAPLEDFAYPIAVAILLPALWGFLGRRRDR
jgi:lycopene cyclase domain-containing protein